MIVMSETAVIPSLDGSPLVQNEMLGSAHIISIKASYHRGR